MQILVDNGVMQVRDPDAGPAIIPPSVRLGCSGEPLGSLFAAILLVVLPLEAIMFPVAFLPQNFSFHSKNNLKTLLKAPLLLLLLLPSSYSSSAWGLLFL